MNKKISCGGFEIDNETLKEENGVLKVVGGGSSSGVLIVNITQQTPTRGVVTPTLVCDKTAAEMYSAAQSGVVMGLVDYQGGKQIAYLNGFVHGEQYMFVFGDYSFTAASGTDYPTATQN